MLICFDGDRTLWDLNYDYNDCCLDLKEWMYDELKLTIPLDIIYITLNAHLKYENKKDNYHRSVFPLCIMRTFNSIYFYEKDKTPPIELLAKAFRIGDKIYDTAPTIKKDSYNILEKIEYEFCGNQLLLLTAGDRVVQGSKIYSTHLTNIFDDITITQHKDAKFYKEIYLLHSITKNAFGNLVIKDCSECIMIGDSIKHDINPALEAGWKAIYVPSSRGEDEKIMFSDNLYFADNLNDVYDILIKVRNDIDDTKSREMS